METIDDHDYHAEQIWRGGEHVSDVATVRVSVYTALKENDSPVSQSAHDGGEEADHSGRDIRLKRHQFSKEWRRMHIPYTTSP